MTMEVLAVALKVECSDGSIHEGIRLAVDGNRRVYLAEDDTEIIDVETVTECRVIVPAMALAAALHRCKECE